MTLKNNISKLVDHCTKFIYHQTQKSRLYKFGVKFVWSSRTLLPESIYHKGLIVNAHKNAVTGSFSVITRIQTKWEEVTMWPEEPGKHCMIRENRWWPRETYIDLMMKLSNKNIARDWPLNSALKLYFDYFIVLYRYHFNTVFKSNRREKS